MGCSGVPDRSVLRLFRLCYVLRVRRRGIHQTSLGHVSGRRHLATQADRTPPASSSAEDVVIQE